MMRLALYALVLSAIYFVIGCLDHNVASSLTIGFVAAILIPGLAQERGAWLRHRAKARSPGPPPAPVADPTDRRQVPTGFDERIGVLEVAVAHIVSRQLRVSRKLAGAVAVQMVTTVFALIGFGLVLDHYHDSRYRAAVTSCGLRNEQNRAIVGFVEQITPRLSARAKTAFPVTRDCAAFARRTTR